MARGNEKDAATRFDRALQVDAAYVPALIGRGQAMLELDRDADALASFEAALAKDPSLTDLRSRVDVLKFRATQDMLARAKAAADARRWDEAAAIYRQAIAASPDSGFLYRDLAAVEQRAGQTANALEHYRKAVEIDAGDARSLAGIGAILESQGDVVGALAAYERAQARLIRGSARDGARRACAARPRWRSCRAEYRAIPASAVGHARRHRGARSASGSKRCSRGRSRDRRSSPTFAGTGRSRGSRRSCGAGVMDPLPNYEFEPSTAGAARRAGDHGVAPADADCARRSRSCAKKWRSARLTINDVRADALELSGGLGRRRRAA